MGNDRLTEIAKPYFASYGLERMWLKTCLNLKNYSKSHYDTIYESQDIPKKNQRNQFLLWLAAAKMGFFPTSLPDSVSENISYSTI